MDITYFGHSSFKLKGKNASVVTDPFSASVGLKFAKHTQADIITISHEHEDHNATDQVEGTPYVIRGPGEYEIAGIGVVGLSTFHDDEKGSKRGKNTVYRFDIDKVSVVHLGDLGHTLTAEDVDSLGEVDVLLVPVGGSYTVDAAKAVQLVKDIEPSIVIPMHFGRSDLNQKIFGDLLPLADFLKEIGKPDAARVSKLSVAKDKIPEELQVVVLE